MNITHISHSDLSGGAARAAYRLHCSLQNSGQCSQMLVQKKISDDSQVFGPGSYFEKLTSLIRIFLGEKIIRLQRSPNYAPHTSSWFPFKNNALQQNASKGSVVHLHWFREFPSISTIGSFTFPVIWTLHDMWAFSGTEHYSTDNQETRWRIGYSGTNRISNHKGLDLDRLTWNRKKKHWKRPFHIVTPSNWLARCVAESALMHNWPVHVIPNLLDVDIFKPLDKSYARNVLNLPPKKKIILFGAVQGGTDLRKGFDLLLTALEKLALSKQHDFTCVVFGQSEPENFPDLGLPVKWLGHLNDEWSLSLLYNAADVMIVPSRQDNLPQTGTEALACGCPVVAFNTTGLPDVVEHKRTGYLAQPFDTDDLAYGISWVLNDKERYELLAVNARKRAMALWAPSVVVPQYLKVYQQAIELH